MRCFLLISIQFIASILRNFIKLDQRFTDESSNLKLSCLIQGHMTRDMQFIQYEKPKGFNCHDFSLQTFKQDKLSMC